MMKISRITNYLGSKKMKTLFSSIMMCVALFALASCNVEEFPHPVDEPQPGDVTFRLDINFETALPIYKEIEITRDQSYDLRYQINAYRLQENGKYDLTQPSATFTYYNSELDRLDQSYEVTLPEGTYRFVVFTDYVSAGNHADLYYNTAEFADIKVNTKPYTGNTDYRDCFNGETTADVTNGGEATVEMTRPLGKYVVIATDAEGFYTRVLEMINNRGGDPAKTTDGTPIDLNNYTVRVVYQQYMPSEFNLFSNRAIDSALGVAYEGQLSTLSTDEIEMAFDYVFVNQDETRVNIQLQVLDKTSQEVLSTSPVITVPMMRSKLTIVRGEFLTSKSSPGMSIDPEFNGEYNIEID